MYINFYGRKTLSPILQKALERFTNTFGVILWRVFTIELIDYFIHVYFEDSKTKERTLYSKFGHKLWGKNSRFLWVGESIMSAIVFNSRLYFNQANLYQDRVRLYARTMPNPPGTNVLFEYVVLHADKNRFEYIPAKEIRIDSDSGEIEETVLNQAMLEEQKTRSRAVHAGAKPGSYAPASITNANGS